MMPFTGSAAQLEIPDINKNGIKNSPRKDHPDFKMMPFYKTLFSDLVSPVQKNFIISFIFSSIYLLVYNFQVTDL
jgi:hypothetical protein